MIEDFTVYARQKFVIQRVAFEEKMTEFIACPDSEPAVQRV
jgi:hypothetical protein